MNKIIMIATFSLAGWVFGSAPAPIESKVASLSGGENWECVQRPDGVTRCCLNGGSQCYYIDPW